MSGHHHISTRIAGTTRLLALVAAAVLARPVVAAPRAQEVDPKKDTAVKAVFLFRFIDDRLNFVTWPPQAFPHPGSPVVLGVMGEDTLIGSVLDRLVRNRTVRGRRIVVRRIESLPEEAGNPGDETSVVDQLKSCHLLFVCRSEAPRLRRILALVETAPILLVSDIDRFALHGGMIELVFNERTEAIDLCINHGAAKRSQLRLSSKLLSIAELVATETR